jgi:hypothetical protein
MSKEEFYKYGESLGIKINDLQRLRMLAKNCFVDDLYYHILNNEHDWSRNPQAQLEDFMQSLNKQDNDKI